MASLIKRAWYQDSITAFGRMGAEDVVNKLSGRSSFDVTLEQKQAWRSSVELLQPALDGMLGRIYFEFEIPRMGSRADVVLFMQGRLLVLEFKAGAKVFTGADLDQACDYALDLKYFHEGSHGLPIVPMLVATEARPVKIEVQEYDRQHGVYQPMRVAGANLRAAIQSALAAMPEAKAEVKAWENSRYSPMPSIVEAARALYAGHKVQDIAHSEGGMNLQQTHAYLVNLAKRMRAEGGKAICFVTGVPGAGKTLAGLNLATEKLGAADGKQINCVYLSGNAPLVNVLREALARDSIEREREKGGRMTKNKARTEVKTFIQNIHHFRDDCRKDEVPPTDRIVIFDESQRCWDQKRLDNFLNRWQPGTGLKKSEAEFLLSCMDRHRDWTVVVCLVGEGQEIKAGEAGIAEWLNALANRFRHWEIHVARQIGKNDCEARKALAKASSVNRTHYSDQLHLSVSMRSFRAEHLSNFVNALLEHEEDQTRELLERISRDYPIRLTRDLGRARAWLRAQASGSERYGLLVSSQAERLKPYAVDVRVRIDPVKWFLNSKDDVRSSYYLEDVATEFEVQGLELDWACVCWDGDFRRVGDGWSNHSFRGKKWQRINSEEGQACQLNAYRVLLTRARQGMVICVPEGAAADPTRSADYYDGTYAYLKSAGIPELEGQVNQSSYQ